MATVAMSSSVAVDLNKIDMFGSDGVRTVERALPMLARLFIDYKMHKSYGVGYLHRHFDIPETSIWVHKVDGYKRDVLPMPISVIDMNKLQGRAFCLEGGEFKAFEWEDLSEDREKLTPEFLAALKKMIEDNGLEQVIALCPRQKQVMLETLLAGEGGTTSVPYDSSKPLGDGLLLEDAQWCFDASAKKPEINAMQRCTINIHGFHFVHDDKTAPVEVALETISVPTDIVDDAPIINSMQRCTINVHGFHFVHDDKVVAETIKVEAPIAVESAPIITAMQRCTINVHGFHFVHDDKAASTEIVEVREEVDEEKPVINAMQRCTINIHGFHFVHDDALDEVADVVSEAV